MAILRDITARLGLQLDKASFVQAERSIGGLTAQLSDLSTLVIGSGAALAFGKIIELGSDANETLNVLDASFGEGSKAVQEWASAFGTAAGRSEFELREMAGTIGAVLNPLMERNGEVAADMSANLAELAVDLGSFFNAADTDVLEALRSGIVGEAEPLKRFGIVMLESTLQAFALSQGIRKNVKDMTVAEKTALRYQFILDQTANAQGDAIRTSEGWANASKGLISAFKDLGVRLGLTVLPFVEKIVIAVRNTVRGFLEWQKGTKFLQAALIVLGAIGAKVALGLILAWAPVLLPMLKFVAIVTIAALVLDDFLTFMAGGNSVIGKFIESIFGPGSAAAAADGLRMAWEGVVLFWRNEVVPALAFVRDAFLSDAQVAGQAWNAFFDDFSEWVIRNEKLLIGFADTVRSTLNAAASLVGIDLNLETSESQRRARMGTSLAGTRQLATEDRLQGAGVRASIAQAAAPAMIDNSVTVTVQGGVTARDATRLADGIEEKQRRQARRTRAALTQRSE
jgi:hypothetical protein